MKLGVGSRLEAAALAARTGLLDRAGPVQVTSHPDRPDHPDMPQGPESPLR
jgi:hypothetical protein